MGNISDIFNNIIQFIQTNLIYCIFVVILLLVPLIYIVIWNIFKPKEKGIIQQINEQRIKMENDAIEKMKGAKNVRNFYTKIDLLLSRSQVKYTFKLHVLHFILISLFMLIVGFIFSIFYFDNYILSILVSVFFMTIPYFLLEVISVIKGKQMEGQVITLIPILMNNAKITQGNIIEMFDRASERINEPLKIYIEEFVNEFKSGVNPDVCFERLKDKVNNRQFRTLIDLLMIHLYKGGNVIVTLNSMKEQVTARQMEKDRRKKENFSNVIGVYMIIILNIVMVFVLSKVMPEVIGQLSSSGSLKYNVVIIAINIIISLFISYKSISMKN